MRNNINIFLLLAIISLVVYGCSKDRIEPDLSNDTITLTSPVDSLRTNVLTQTFRWTTSGEASNYTLNIISGNIASANFTVLDTTISSQEFTHALPLGDYFWRVKAVNSEYESRFSTNSLFLTNDNSSDLTNQLVSLTAPVHLSYINNLNVVFNWADNPFIDEYRFELSAPDFNGTSLISPQVVNGTSYTHLFASEGTYSWRVRGENETTNTLYTTYSFDIDTTRPTASILLLPIDNSILSDSLVSFNWNSPIDQGSPVSDSIFIFSDSTMINTVHNAAGVNSSYSFVLITGTYYWHTVPFDEAGNTGVPSSIFSFNIQ